MRRYKPHLTATENDKGVLDLDTVKGCTEGMRAHPDGGCYGACYAARIANYRGIDFGHSVVRYATSPGALRSLQRQVARSPLPFVRIGVMGDPSHDWPGTVRTARWVLKVGKPVVIITKWWRVPSEADVAAMAHSPAPGVVVNTSVSALDSDAELEHRLAQHHRLQKARVHSYLRIISCDFDTTNTEGARLAARQAELLALDGGQVIRCDALRCPSTHPLVVAGVVRVAKHYDLNSEVSMSLHDEEGIYRGRCDLCPDRCGVHWATTAAPAAD